MSRADIKIILKKSKEHKWVFIFLIEFHFLSFKKSHRNLLKFVLKLRVFPPKVKAEAMYDSNAVSGQFCPPQASPCPFLLHWRLRPGESKQGISGLRGEECQSRELKSRTSLAPDSEHPLQVSAGCDSPILARGHGTSIHYGRLMTVDSDHEMSAAQDLLSPTIISLVCQPVESFTLASGVPELSPNRGD